jgi:hypothetical protein
LTPNEHFKQEWLLIENTALTENQRFFTTKAEIAHITNITHEMQLLSEVIKKRDVVFGFS